MKYHEITKFFIVFIVFSLFKYSIAETNMSIYEFSFTNIDGELVKLEDFKGKPLLVVNTASRCGFTPQYKDLQDLFVKYRDTDLTIIAITSNSFNQEYETPEEIKKICLVNYNIGFITSSPLKVKGDNAHPIYNWIKNEYNKVPKWNFYKYLFDREGKLIGSWSSVTKPNSYRITRKINSTI
tara:strand:- start:57 stop:602 length:546 start_codon:yes stop_codon:yes gene_type:complete